MMPCDVQMSGAVELYFYGELEPGERASVERHLSGCATCRLTLEDLAMIRQALSSRPTVDAPADGDWGPFMRRLDDAIQVRASVAAPVVLLTPRSTRTLRAAPLLAMAALVTLVTSGVVYVARHAAPEGARPVSAPLTTHTTASPEPAPSRPSPRAAEMPESGFAALSEQHFERSKLVVLGLANKDVKAVNEADWAYERGLATNLLDDTRLYRMAAEERGMTTVAGVMGDLELVLLQTSLADAPDSETLGRIQRLIHKRDLVTKLDVANGS
jgi:hypothetical protein